MQYYLIRMAQLRYGCEEGWGNLRPAPSTCPLAAVPMPIAQREFVLTRRPRGVR